MLTEIVRTHLPLSRHVWLRRSELLALFEQVQVETCRIAARFAVVGLDDVDLLEGTASRHPKRARATLGRRKLDACLCVHLWAALFWSKGHGWECVLHSFYYKYCISFTSLPYVWMALFWILILHLAGYSFPLSASSRFLVQIKLRQHCSSGAKRW